MNNSTSKSAVIFGEKASCYSTEICTRSTTVHLDEIALTESFSYCSGIYKTVDYSEEKKMETYRKVNKMLGGK